MKRIVSLNGAMIFVRPYLRIAALREELPNVPVLGINGIGNTGSTG